MKKPDVGSMWKFTSKQTGNVIFINENGEVTHVGQHSVVVTVLGTGEHIPPYSMGYEYARLLINDNAAIVFANYGWFVTDSYNYVEKIS